MFIHTRLQGSENDWTATICINMDSMWNTEQNRLILHIFLHYLRFFLFFKDTHCLRIRWFKKGAFPLVKKGSLFSSVLRLLTPPPPHFELSDCQLEGTESFCLQAEQLRPSLVGKVYGAIYITPGLGLLHPPYSVNSYTVSHFTFKTVPLTLLAFISLMYNFGQITCNLSASIFSSIKWW